MSSKERKDGLVISQKELYYGIAALLCAALFIFVSGYFFGKKRVLEELAAQYDDECFADKVYQSFASLTDTSSSDPSGADTSGDGEEAESEQQKPDSSSSDALGADTAGAGSSVIAAPENAAYAQLCGFGTKQAAELYVDRVRRRGISVNIVERKSRSKRGRTVTWYQVVTQIMERQELEELVQKMKKDDKLTSVQIVDVVSEAQEAAGS